MTRTVALFSLGGAPASPWPPWPWPRYGPRTPAPSWSRPTASAVIVRLARAPEPRRAVRRGRTAPGADRRAGRVADHAQTVPGGLPVCPSPPSPVRAAGPSGCSPRASARSTRRCRCCALSSSRAACPAAASAVRVAASLLVRASSARAWAVSCARFAAAARSSSSSTLARRSSTAVCARASSSARKVRSCVSRSSRSRTSESSADAGCAEWSRAESPCPAPCARSVEPSCPTSLRPVAFPRAAVPSVPVLPGSYGTVGSAGSPCLRSPRSGTALPSVESVVLWADPSD
ncbi:hypothetical protein DFP74_4000 [Nocardiopsis sp. Huas11]|nr:hypothetical protein DFP74_4000 [Nocardiopsis sp. Huas11]